MKKWRLLATDFDGTIAHHGVVSPTTQQALRRARDEGLDVLLVTGRELRDFAGLDIDLSLFNLVVAENGAVLYDPLSAAQTLLAPAPTPEFVAELERRGVTPLSVGLTIVATVEPHEVTVIEVIKEMGLELTVTFNKGAVMILPSNVNKATGMSAALEKMQIPASAVVGVGDAENDHAFLSHCGLAVAVSNALPALKEHAHWVTQGKAGEGVTELIEGLLSGQFDAGVPVAATV